MYKIIGVGSFPILGVGAMRGSKDFCQWGGGGGSKPNCQKTALTFFLCFFFFRFFFSSPQLILQFYRGCPMVISKKTIIFRGFRGGPTFSRGFQHFPGGGVQMLIFIVTHITCNFTGGVRTPYPPLDPHMGAKPSRPVSILGWGYCNTYIHARACAHAQTSFTI